MLLKKYYIRSTTKASYNSYIYFVVELISFGFPLVDCLVKSLNLVFEFVNEFSICCLYGIKNVKLFIFK